jgi:ubiquitin-protein ligase
MDLARIRREIDHAQREFSFVESHPTSDGRVYVLCALQTTQARLYTLQIEFPDSYPYVAPWVAIRRPTISSSTPHRYPDGRICFMLPKLWNPGQHNLTFVIMRCAKWLAKYEVWSSGLGWPGAEVSH